MTANVELTDTFGGFRTKTNELVVMTHDGMNNFIKILDTTDSTSNITGSIVTAGGIGVAGSGTIGGNFNVHGNLHANGAISADGSLTFGDAATDNVVFAADVNSHIIPNTDDTYDLGSSGQKWKDIYIDGVSYLDAINLNGTAISASATELNLLDNVTGLVQADFTKLAAVDASAAEVNLIDGSSAGTIVNSKAVIYGGSGEVNGTTLQIAGSSITSSAAELNLLDGVSGLVQADLTKLAAVDASAAELNILDGVTASFTELNYNDITTLGTAEVSKTVTSDGSGNVTFVDGTNDIDIASHDGSNGLKLGGVLLTQTAASLNTVGGLSTLLTGLTATATELNLLDGVAGLVQADLTKLAAVDASAAELNLLDNVTGLVQADFTKLAAIDTSATDLNNSATTGKSIAMSIVFGG